MDSELVLRSGKSSLEKYSLCSIRNASQFDYYVCLLYLCSLIARLIGLNKQRAHGSIKHQEIKPDTSLVKA